MSIVHLMIKVRKPFFYLNYCRSKIKTRTKLVHKNVDHGYEKVKLHIMNLHLNNVNIHFNLIKISKRSRKLLTKFNNVP